MEFLALSYAICLCIPKPAWAGSSDISRRLGKLVETLAEGYQSKNPGGAGETLAVFTLNSSAELEKKRVGFAVAELLTNLLIRDQTFSVVERTELNKVLSEQKLQFTGAIDPSTAVEMGKLLGARLLLLGSIEKFGGKYQVNARLVRVETGEALAAAFEELDAGLFEEEAKPYLVLVPEREAIGIYLVWGLRPYDVHAAEATVFKGNNTVESQFRYVAPASPNNSTDFVGMGFRYFPESWLMADLAYIPTVSSFNGTTSVFPDPAGETLESTLRFHGRALKGSANLVKGISKTLRVYGGLGLTAYLLEGVSDSAVYSQSNLFSILLEKVSFSKTLLHPFSRVGLEWRPSPRVGLAIFENIGLAQVRYTVRAYVGGTGSEPSRDIILYTFTPLRFSTEVSLGFYF